MNRQDLRDALFDCVRAVAPDATPETLADDADLRDALDIDSMDFLGFVSAIHQTLGVAVPESDYPHLTTLAACEAYLTPRV